MRRLFFLIVATITVVGCRSAPESLTVALSSDSSALASATMVAQELDDRAQRAETLAVVAEGFLGSGNPGDALTIAREAGRLINEIQLTDETANLHLRIAALLLSVEETAAARQLIIEATDYVETIRDEGTRAALLVSVVQVVVGGEDDTRDLVAAVVDPVYIIEDTGLRARTLIAVAAAYQAVGAGQEVTGLIQQAIPAIRSEADPFRRAKLFADLSSPAFSAGQNDLARSLVEDAQEELYTGALNGIPDIATVSAVGRALTRDRGGVEAMLVLSRLEGPQSQAAGFVAIGAEEESGESAEFALARARDACDAVEDPRVYVDLMTSIAQGYLKHGFRPLALQAAQDAATRVAEHLPVMSDIETLTRLAGVFAVLDQPDAVRQFADQFDVAYFRGLLAVSVAELLITEGRQGVADDFLVDALLEADQSDELSDTLREKITRGFSSSGNYSLAIRTIERMADPWLQARAVAHLGSFADANGGLSQEQDADLRSVLGL